MTPCYIILTVIRCAKKNSLRFIISSLWVQKMRNWILSVTISIWITWHKLWYRMSNILYFFGGGTVYVVNILLYSNYFAMSFLIFSLRWIVYVRHPINELQVVMCILIQHSWFMPVCLVLLEMKFKWSVGTEKLQTKE